MNRRIARLRAVQTLYQLTLITNIEVEQAIQNTLNEEEEPSDFYKTLLYGTIEHQDEIDFYLGGNLKGYTLDRLGHVDRAIARMSLFEMLYIEDIQMNITLNEAIELAKAFGGEDAGRFMNGVLSNSYDAALKNKSQ